MATNRFQRQDDDDDNNNNNNDDVIDEDKVVKPYDSETEVKGCPTGLIAFTLFMGFAVYIGVILYNANHTPVKNGNKGLKAGGTLVSLTSQVIIDDKPLNDLFNVLTTLDANCRPTIGADVYNRLQIGTLSDTTAAWQEVKAEISGVCDFYGLVAMENRSQSMEGPAEICHAYFTIALETIAIKYNYQEIASLYPIAIEIVNVAYPLNLFWKYSVGTSNFNVAGLAIAQIEDFIKSTDRRPSKYAAAFCNQFFATDQRDYYTSIFQPWLAFPFEGVLQRQSNTLIPPALDTLLSQVQTGGTIKAIYAIGDAYASNSGVQLLIDTFLDGAEVTQLNMPVADALNYIHDSITIGGSQGSTAGGPTTLNISAIPVLVIGRYADAAGTYNGFKVDQTSVIFMFTDDDPQGLLKSSSTGNMSLPTQIQAFATSSKVMGVLDFTTDHPYEANFGFVYTEEKDVSDIISAILGSMVGPSWQKSAGLLDTFAIKNTVVNGIDIGGRLKRQELIQDLLSQNIVLGLKPNAFSSELEEIVVEDDNETYAEVFGAAPPGTIYVTPSFVDWRNRAPLCIPPVEDQNVCNCCWAIGSSDSISVQLCHTYGVPIEHRLSHQHIVGCAIVENNNGCAPQAPGTGFTMMYGDIHTYACMPLSNKGTKDLGCPTTCQNGNLDQLSIVNGIQSGSYAKLTGAAAIKKFMDLTGPVAAGFTITQDFKNFFASNPNGIFNPNDFVGPSAGGHMVLCYGYYDNVPVPYWLCQNSWTTNWGSQGQFKVAQNIKSYVNTTMWIETNAYVGVARLGSITPKTTVELIPGNQTSAVETKPTVYTTKYGCPKLIQNTAQEDAAAALNGCPSNNARKTKTGKLANEKGVVQKSAAARLKPEFSLFSMSVILAMII